MLSTFYLIVASDGLWVHFLLKVIIAKLYNLWHNRKSTHMHKYQIHIPQEKLHRSSVEQQLVCQTYCLLCWSYFKELVKACLLSLLLQLTCDVGTHSAKCIVQVYLVVVQSQRAHLRKGGKLICPLVVNKTHHLNLKHNYRETERETPTNWPWDAPHYMHEHPTGHVTHHVTWYKAKSPE